jgi:putative FmdB family regulatory protein
MPTYEYACSKCGNHFDRFQSMRDEPLKKCPKCGKPALKRLIGGGAGLIFKGTGFYITDYKNKAPTKAEAGESKPPSEAKPESKPAEAPKAAAAASPAPTKK